MGAKLCARRRPRLDLTGLPGRRHGCTARPADRDSRKGHPWAPITADTGARQPTVRSQQRRDRRSGSCTGVPRDDRRARASSPGPGGVAGLCARAEALRTWPAAARRKASRKRPLAVVGIGLYFVGLAAILVARWSRPGRWSPRITPVGTRLPLVFGSAHISAAHDVALIALLITAGPLGSTRSSRSPTSPGRSRHRARHRERIRSRVDGEARRHRGAHDVHQRRNPRRGA